MGATHCPFRIGDRQLDRRRGVAYAGVPLREHLEAMLRCRFDALVSWKLASITAGSCSSSAPQQSPDLRVAAAIEIAETRVHVLAAAFRHCAGKRNHAGSDPPTLRPPPARSRLSDSEPGRANQLEA
jgi:hypothetical protein